MSEDQSTANEPVVETLAESLEAAFEANVAEPEEKPVVEAKEVEKEVSAEDSTESSADALVETKTEVEKSDEAIPPEHWSDEAKGVFVELDERGREFALSQEKNFNKGIEKKSAELKTFRDAFQPYKHLFPEGAEAQAVQQLFNAQASLQTNPVESIKWLMKNYGVDEKQFAPSTEATDEFADPEVTALRAELKALKSTTEQNALNAQTTQQNAMIAEINQFRDAEDKGELLHPHFNNVSGVMSGLMQSGRADSLEDAYKQAVWSLPEYRDSEVERIAAEKAASDLKERTVEATKAEKAAKAVNGANSTTTDKKPVTLTDSLNEAYDKSVKGEL